jgi:tetrapyrrole methylase family protein/MazG family protein/ATP diphosphatase
MPEAKPPSLDEPSVSPAKATSTAATNPRPAGKASFDEMAPRPVPPLAAQDGATLVRLTTVMQRLLAEDGCPWDREQSFETLRKYVLEEACEVIDAIDSGDRAALREELGDLLLQVVFQAELARKEGAFAIDDVIEGIVEKLVRRHPHVFGTVAAKNADEVLSNWEKLKAKEKGERGILSGVPRSMPALTRAQRIGEKVARVGFDWSDARGSRAKVGEEIAELDRAIANGDAAGIEEELGDVLFALVNLSRHVGVDAEGSLRRTIDKFTTRFAHVERRVREEHGGWAGKESGQGGQGGQGKGAYPLPLEVLDRYWEEAKRGE